MATVSPRPLSSGPRVEPAVRRVIVLGSTGSIGRNTLAVIDHLNDLVMPEAGRRVDPEATAWRYEVTALAAGGNNIERLIEQARRFGAAHVAIADADRAGELSEALPGVVIHAGPDAATELVESLSDDAGPTDLVAAIVGAAGLGAVLAGIRAGMRIHLANKETLVAAGALVAPMLARSGVTMLPVDSEHSAIFQCLASRASGPGHATAATGDRPHPDVRRVVLTASGGPFREASLDQIRSAGVEAALEHPTWKMGAKITIDSATMMNKALELLEAHWLFGLGADRLGVVVHPQSVIHSFVEFTDHSVLAQLGPPDMKTPIQYALTYPQRAAGSGRAMDWTTACGLHFEPPDLERFPSLSLAYDVIERVTSPDGRGQSAGAVFNAANEEAVLAFLDRRIRLGGVFDLVGEALSGVPVGPISSLDDVLEADASARSFVRSRVGRLAAGTHPAR